MKLLDRVRGFFGHVDTSDVEAEADELLARGPLTHDVCATCGKPLYLSDRVEVLVSAVGFDDEFGGSFGTLATYCTDDAPEAT